ncbi:MAG: hypothetical protein LBK71_06195 [Verrucomicrobiales bacterium]|jgi:hypothetical protein|nr:hypothetical protein [Verrucomicrobiales bacterium]
MKIPKLSLIGLCTAAIGLAVAAWWWRERWTLDHALQLTEFIHLAGKCVWLLRPHHQRRLPRVARRK